MSNWTTRKIKKITYICESCWQEQKYNDNFCDNCGKEFTKEIDFKEYLKEET